MMKKAKKSPGGACITGSSAKECTSDWVCQAERNPSAHMLSSWKFDNVRGYSRDECARVWTDTADTCKRKDTSTGIGEPFRAKLMMHTLSNMWLPNIWGGCEELGSLVVFSRLTDKWTSNIFNSVQTCWPWAFIQGGIEWCSYQVIFGWMFLRVTDVIPYRIRTHG